MSKFVPGVGTTLLISGSRECSDDAKDTARRAVARAKENKWRVIVGDAPGIDWVVIDTCIELGVEFHCFGISPVPRYLTDMKNFPYTRVVIPGSAQVWQRYYKRDEVMVDFADKVFAVWNGSSRGTKYTYDYAVKKSKEAWIVTR